jgi:hypothetical protein
MLASPPMILGSSSGLSRPMAAPSAMLASDCQTGEEQELLLRCCEQPFHCLQARSRLRRRLLLLQRH